MLLTFAIVGLVIVIIECIVASLLLWSLVANIFSQVPYVQIPDRGLTDVLEAVDISAGARVVDLGAGDGRVLVAVEKKFGVVGVGYEISLWPWVVARWQLWRSGLRSRVYLRDFYKVDLSEANVVFCFLTQPVMAQLEKKLKATQFSAGTQLILYGNYLPNWRPVRVIAADKARGRLSAIYLYHV